MPNRESRRFYEYDLEYLFQPGLWQKDTELATLRHELEHVNHLSGRGLNYGIFDPECTPETLREFFSRSALCVMRLKGEPVGFFYNMVLREGRKPAIHAGLVVIGRNNGIDLLSIPYMHLIVLQHRKYGNYHYTNISATPSIIGSFADGMSDVWPNYRGNAKKPPSREYLSVLSLLHHEYIERYFPRNKVQIDAKRFVMRSPQQEMGFEQDPRQLSRHARMEANTFCAYWLDYSRGEDMIQVGQVRRLTALKLQAALVVSKLKELMVGRRSPKLRERQELKVIEGGAAGTAVAEREPHRKAA